MKQTAMQKLINQLKDERQNLPMNIEWDRCYQAIEMLIQTTYLSMEKEQIESAYRKGHTESSWGRHSNSENYYNETFKSE
jgi:hypothetical protein